ncbi:hypothetical protein RRG08_013185 [Elysia crispata]|uniref:Uncharacterized protein n=1 Tax=Elysia crispata TaxID=231223 RepID=A0AAE1EAC9_9GAST|nr:hypothetical protein RRG08_013185 [Elysia crispata]
MFNPSFSTPRMSRSDMAECNMGAVSNENRRNVQRVAPWFVLRFVKCRALGWRKQASPRTNQHGPRIGDAVT